MKKRILLYFFGVFNVILVHAQVGVNTNNPQGIFHVDGTKDNGDTQNPTADQLSNDMIINKNANIGIGTLPEDNAKISINLNTSINTEIGKGFRLKDGTEGDGNLLSLINTNGDIAWEKRVSTIMAKFGAGFNGSVMTDMASTETTITLPPGNWLIRSSIILRVYVFNGTYSEGLFAQLSWADKNTDGTFTLTPDAVSGNVFGGAYLGMYSLAFGQTIINNTSTTTKTYYLISRTPKTWGTTIQSKTWQNLGGNGWGENAIIAFAAN